jgi:LacI family transcriptional regulator
MAVTLEDVALKAGVSHTTVSLVLHGDKKISEKTRIRVMDIIQEMNYHPNYNARSLAKGKTNTIAVLASFYSSFFAMDIMKGIEDSAIKTDFDLNQYSTRGDKERELNQVRSILYGRRADGIIIISLQPGPETLKEFKDADIPVVIIERRIDGISCVRTDNEKGAYMAAEHLIKSGRKNIGIVCGHLDCYDCVNARERNTGFMKAINDYGLKLDKRNCANSWYEFNDGATAMKEIYEKGGRPDAVFCASGDPVAFGFMKEAQRMGIKVPQDMAVVGYDDILASSLVYPALTTVRQPITEMGKQALNIMVKTINGELKEATTTTFEPELIIRESAI